MNTRSLMALLGYGGLLPFYGSATWGLMQLPGHGAAIDIFITYAVVILAFLGGTLWGYAVRVSPPRKHARLLLSNVVVLFAGLAALAGSQLLSISMLVVGQLAVLAYERHGGDVSGWYLQLRTRLTLGVLPAHGLAGLAVV